MSNQHFEWIRKGSCSPKAWEPLFRNPHSEQLLRRALLLLPKDPSSQAWSLAEPAV